ncbi:MAG: hypothetical protein AB7F31_07025 [Parachlamydiales bacterium]
MKGLFLLALLLMPALAHAHHLESCLQVEGEWVLLLDDTSCWELSPMKPKEQSWSEWWHGVQPKQPDERFLVDLTEWKRGGEIGVYHEGQAPIAGFPYLLEHQPTGQLVYARLLPSDRIHLPKTAAAKAFQQNGAFSHHTIRKALDLQGERVLVLEDNTIWHLQKIRENSRTISQWWSGIELEQPDKPFLFSRSSWEVGDELGLTAYHWGSLGLATFYEATEGVGRYSYLLENPVTGEMAFATPLSTSDLVERLIRYAEERYNQGHSAGYSSGYSAGYNAGYNRGSVVAQKQNEATGDALQAYTDGLSH